MITFILIWFVLGIIPSIAITTRDILLGYDLLVGQVFLILLISVLFGPFLILFAITEFGLFDMVLIKGRKK